jgi:transposase-like protein
MHIEKAIKHAGSVSALARIVGCSRQVVQHWRKSGIPSARLETIRALRPEWFKK